LSSTLNQYSRADIQRFIKDGVVSLNSDHVSRKNTPVLQNDIIKINLPSRPIVENYKPSFELKCIYEDDYILIIDKPRGVSVHPGASKYPEETILDCFKYYYPRILEDTDSERPGIVHRLDKATTGVLILAKSHKIQIVFQEMFKKREIKKNYLAIVHNRVRFLKGKIEKPLIRSEKYRTKYVTATDGVKNSRDALTYYKLLFYHSNYSYLRLSPKTGRTHQLRVHLQSIRHPILGDKKYGKQQDKFPFLALHAYSIEFYHPYLNKNIFAHSPLPEELRDFLSSKNDN
jgi:23S rRNA pseudouridine1911/1915/1917 synthase